LDLLDIKQTINDWFQSFFSDLATSLYKIGTQLLRQYLAQSTDLNQLPKVWEILQWTQLGAQVLATIFLLIRLFQAVRDVVTGEAEPNYAEIIGSFILTFALIFATPYIVTHFFFKVNNAVLASLPALGISLSFPDKGVTDLLTDPMMGLDKQAVVTALMGLIWSLGYFAFALVSAIRYAEIAGLLVLGPLLATSVLGRSDAYRVYWMETAAVVFLQPFHFLLAYWILSSLDKGIMGVIFSLGCSVIGIRGPHLLRQWMYGAGTRGTLIGAIGGARRLDVYPYLIKHVGRG
jgi:hypothetical protein